eukprot:jgi/Mesvir1/29176/Mv13863-RA.1
MAGDIIKVDRKLTGFIEEDHDLLVLIVKEAQRAGIKGSQGDWKTFIAHDKETPWTKNPADPARRPWTVLAKFVATFTEEADIKRVAAMRKWHKSVQRDKAMDAEDPWPPSRIQDMVLGSRAHPNYERSFSFPSFQQDWVHIPRSSVAEAGGDARPRLLSLDCEMCVVEGSRKELLKLAVMDQDLKVLFSDIVKPSRPVLDLKTEITGVTEEDVENATVTFEQAQRAVVELITPGTVLIGHGLSHDLTALKIDYRRVIDTSLYFRYDRLSAATPALADLCQLLLKTPFRAGGLTSVHDVIEDASTPMRLVLREIALPPGEATGPLAPPSDKVIKDDLNKLFIHRLPKSKANAETVAMLFPDPAPVTVQPFSHKQQHASTYLVFASVADANAAFKRLPGHQGKDSKGRPQKVIDLKRVEKMAASGQQAAGDQAPPPGKEPLNGVCVRKMACHNGAAFGEDADFAAEKRKEKKKEKRRLKREAKLLAAGGAGDEGVETRRGDGQGAEQGPQGGRGEGACKRPREEDSSSDSDSDSDSSSSSSDDEALPPLKRSGAAAPAISTKPAAAAAIASTKAAGASPSAPASQAQAAAAEDKDSTKKKKKEGGKGARERREEKRRRKLAGGEGAAHTDAGMEGRHERPALAAAAAAPSAPLNHGTPAVIGGGRVTKAYSAVEPMSGMASPNGVSAGVMATAASPGASSLSLPYDAAAADTAAFFRQQLAEKDRQIAALQKLVTDLVAKTMG